MTDRRTSAAETVLALTPCATATTRARRPERSYREGTTSPWRDLAPPIAHAAGAPLLVTAARAAGDVNPDSWLLRAEP